MQTRWLRRFMALVLGILLITLSACSGQPVSGLPEKDFSRVPASADYSFFARKHTAPPVRPTGQTDTWAADFRHGDLTAVDLSSSGDVLLDLASFDTDTRWPQQMPAGYDPARILELGKDPGLGVRALHARGITGKGVNVAFFDQTLLLDHEQYAGRVRRYREVGKVAPNAEMHGAAVTSLLSGKTVGVAPDVNIVYYAVQFGTGEKEKARTFVYLAKAINDLLDLNRTLPEKEKVRVIGMSIGWSPQEAGYAEIVKAVARAKQEGVFVISTSVDRHYAFKFHGLNRSPLADPNDPASYRPGSWWQSQFYANPAASEGRILVPMDSRTMAGPTGQQDYAFDRNGGWSWVVPYLVGVYAMAQQVKPDVTPEQFYQAALATGHFTEFTYEGKSYRLGPIINPAGIIDKLTGK